MMPPHQVTFSQMCIVLLKQFFLVSLFSIDVPILYFHIYLPSQVATWHQRRLTKLLTKWWKNLILVKMSHCPMQTLNMSSPKHPTLSTFSGSHFSKHQTLFTKYKPDSILTTHTHMYTHAYGLSGKGLHRFTMLSNIRSIVLLLIW